MVEQNNHIQSALIGYYRNGATLEVISLLTGFNAWNIQDTIDNYLKTKNEKINHQLGNSEKQPG